MCGIAGIVNFKGLGVDASMIHKMTNGLSHRGPDAEGFFVDPFISLGHRRLSIIDLSAAANQPFYENSGRYVLIFNGEMYNYASVKLQLPEYEFHTGSDSEVLIAAYAMWGPECLGHFRGMFAFAIWDKQEKEIFVARDPMGVKPLYYFLDREHFVFASEIRSIALSGMVEKKVSQEALIEFFSFQSVGHLNSAINGIRQLEAGSWMKIKNGKTEKKVYWDLTGLHARFDFTDKAGVEKKIHELLLKSVERRLVSDVPVGAFLSGGIDSSAVVGLMAEASQARPNTFNVCFDEKEYDESGYASLVAKKFNANHERILLKPAAFLEELQNALEAMDTPSGDGINTYVVSKAIRKKGMTVALSGIGGDELFAGYPVFQHYLQLQNKQWLWKLPMGLRKFAASVITGSTKDRVSQLLQVPSCTIENVYPIFRQILSPRRIRELTTLTSTPGGDFITALQKELLEKKENLLHLPLLSQVSAAEWLGYTQHTLLKDTDQMSMAVSLEVREPFFDLDLVEFVLSVPDTLKKPQYPKSLLVESLKPLLPDEIVFRKKQGFVFPWNLWLRNELKSFCELHIKNMSQRTFIRGQQLMKYWKDFQKGHENIRWPEIWLFVVLDYWMGKNGIQ
jgi:asparagine synthase (glutamine-hydrolysing)